MTMRDEIPGLFGVYGGLSLSALSGGGKHFYDNANGYTVT